MFNIGIGEFLFIFLAIFLLFGPESLPQIAKKMGEFINQFKKSIDEASKEVKK